MSAVHTECALLRAPRSSALMQRQPERGTSRAALQAARRHAPSRYVTTSASTSSSSPKISISSSSISSTSSIAIPIGTGAAALEAIECGAIPVVDSHYFAQVRRRARSARRPADVRAPPRRRLTRARLRA